MSDKKRPTELTYEKVAQAADHLHANGVARPSANAVRAFLKDQSSNGSVGAQTQIQKLLNQWHCQLGATAAASPPPALSPALRMQLERELGEIAKKMRQENGDEIAQLREEQEELLRENCAQDEQLDALAQDLCLRATERDALSGQLGSLTLEALALKAALALAHDAAKNVQFELGQAHSHRQAAQDCAAQKTIDAVQLTEQVQRLHAELSTSRNSAELLQSKLDGEVQARHSAALAHAVLQAQVMLQLGSARASGQAKRHLRGRGGHAMSPPGR